MLLLRQPRQLWNGLVIYETRKNNPVIDDTLTNLNSLFPTLFVHYFYLRKNLLQKNMSS